MNDLAFYAGLAILFTITILGFERWLRRRRDPHRAAVQKYPIQGIMGEQVMHGKNLETGESVTRPALQDSEKAGDPLSAREIHCIENNECPDCGGEIRWGPSGGMSQNVKCFGACGRRFNYTGPLSDRLDDRTHRNGSRIRPANQP